MRSGILAFLAFLVASGLAHAGCPADATTEAFLAPGPHAVGVRTLTLVDTSRVTPAHAGIAPLPSRTLMTQVWYPADGPAGQPPVADAPLAVGGPFPLVVNSHGFSELNIGCTYIAEALARRGFIVAAPNFPLTNLTAPGGPWLPDVTNQPGDVRFVLDQLVALSNTAGSWLAGGVDERRIGAQGLSLGGLTTLLATYNPRLRDRRIRAAFTMAPYSCPLTRKLLRSSRPLVLVNGDHDLITPLEQNAGRTFVRGRMPRRLITLAGATHTAFTGLINGPATSNYDAAFGCAGVEGISQEILDETLATFGPAAAGADLRGCDLPCRGSVPPDPSMTADRQHELTQAIAVAFFQERLQKSRAARCFLNRTLSVENAEVTLRRRPR
jgi:predicted dienelactone hydrolase